MLKRACNSTTFVGDNPQIFFFLNKKTPTKHKNTQTQTTLNCPLRGGRDGWQCSHRPAFRAIAAR